MSARPRALSVLVVLALLFLVEGSSARAGVAPPLPTPPPTPWTRRPVPPLAPAALLRKAEATWRRTVNVHAPAVYPSPSYGGIYLRDTFWVTGALDDTALSLAMRRQFAGFQRPSGQLPSYFVAWRRGPRYNADESTILYVLWTCRDAVLFNAPLDTRVLQGALRYIRRFVHHGAYVSPPGDGRSWLDALRLPRAETLSYTQGLYAAAVACARSLGAPVTRAEVQEAQSAYAALYNRQLHYLPLGSQDEETDVSSLTGEFVALWLLGRPLLSDSMVLSTVRHFVATPAGYKVVSQPDGAYLPSSAFTVPLAPGDYQNGGAWLLYDELALAAASLHGWRPARALMARRIALDAVTGRLFDEYTCTNPQLRCFHFSIPARRDTAWNTFVLVAQQLVADRRAVGVAQARIGQP